MLQLAKAVLGGIVFAAAVLLIRLLLLERQFENELARQGRNNELVATAGGLIYALHQPVTIVLVSMAFGFGFWIVVRR